MLNTSSEKTTPGPGPEMAVALTCAGLTLPTNHSFPSNAATKAVRDTVYPLLFRGANAHPEDLALAEAIHLALQLQNERTRRRRSRGGPTPTPAENATHSGPQRRFHPPHPSATAGRVFYASPIFSFPRTKVSLLKISRPGKCALTPPAPRRPRETERAPHHPPDPHAVPPQHPPDSPPSSRLPHVRSRPGRPGC